MNDEPEIQELTLEPMNDVARFNAQQDFTKPGVVMGADGVVRPYTPPSWLNQPEASPAKPSRARRFFNWLGGPT